MNKAFAAAAVGLLFTSALAVAQTAATAPEPAASPAPKRQPSAKTLACRETAKEQGLKGKAARESVKSCVTAARDACRDQTKDLKGKERREKMKACMSG